MHPSQSAAANLIAEHQRVETTATPPPPEPVASLFAENAPPVSVRQNARNTGEVVWTVRLLQISVAVNVILAGLFYATSEITVRRPQQMVQIKGDLRDQIRVHLSTPSVSRDRLISFLLMALPVRHGVTTNGAPFLAILQGLMTSGIYNETAQTVEKNLSAIQAHRMSQSLLIEGISGIDYDKEAERISAVVSGRLQIQAAATASGGQLTQSRPYRALVVLDILPVTELNPYGFFIVSLREATSDASVRAFDKEMEARRERAIGN